MNLKELLTLKIDGDTLKRLFSKNTSSPRGKSKSKQKNTTSSKTKGKKSLGLDIGHHSIKLVELVPKNGLLVRNQIEIPTPEGLFHDNEIVNYDLLTRVLKTAKSKYKIGTTDIYAIFPRTAHSLLLRSLKIPYLPIEDLYSTYLIEAEKQIILPNQEPFTSEPYVCDFVLLDEFTEAGKKYYLVQFTALEKDASYQLFKAVQKAGFKLLSVEVDFLAQWRVYSNVKEYDPEQNLIFLDIGHNSSNILSVRDREILAYRTVDFGGNTLTSAIKRGFKLSEEQAEEWKLKRGTRIRFTDNEAENTVNKKYKGLLDDTFDSLISEINRSLNIFRSRGLTNNGDTSRRARLVISGSTASLKNLNLFLASKLDLDIEIWKLTESTQIGTNKLVLPPETLLNPSMVTALGLSLREVLDDV